MSPLAPHNSQSIAGYTLIERIGAGGYGEVWKAEAPGGLEKAVKLIYGYLDDQRAAGELRALQRIKEARHPFLLSVERIEVIDGQLMVVTELADMSLKDRYEACRNDGQCGIPREELLVYVGDAADALDYMRESHGLQHLDVKPENLLITSGRVKVADFGLVKSIRDEHVSLLGGLTPQYAPPELFDGCPSHSSDQYSLAIVYQEMLTGASPFPGRSAAQLANQHLHSPPQLRPLLPADRGVIARALSKDPSARFASCRQMVDAIRGASDRPGGALRSELSDGRHPGNSSSDTSSILDKDTHPARKPAALGDGTAPPPQRIQTVVIGRSLDNLQGDEDLICPHPVELPPGAEPVNLEPVEIADESIDSTPTLILGIGGTAAATLRSLRARILRDEDSYTQANLELLLLDTDPQTVERACGDRCAEALEFRETMLLPLRSSAEYREQSAAHLQWLSRRWLYNIPRSLRTQGRRPLGRLAFADHAGEVAARIRKALLDLSAKGKNQADAAEGVSARGRVRVMIVCSISGGTGSGMAADIGYLVRQIIAELGFAQAAICGLLTHSTASNPEQQELAIANMYACLSELEHYATSGFPGDGGCGLRSSRERAFGHTYLVHLGDNLDDASHAAAVDKLAEYLYLNVASSASRFFDLVRSNDQPDTGSGNSVPLRTFGIHQFDPHHNDVTSLAVKEVSRSVVLRWLGGSGYFKKHPLEEYLAARYPEMRETARGSRGKSKGRGTRAEDSRHGRGVQSIASPDALYDAVTSALQQHLGEDAVRYCERLIKRAKASRETRNKPAFLAQLERSLAPRQRPGEEVEAPPSELEQALAADAEGLADEAIHAIRATVSELLSNPDAGIVSAQHAVQWLCDRLRQLERTTSAELGRLDERLSAMEASLPDRVSFRSGGLGRLLGRRRSAAYDDSWPGYCLLRTRMVVLQTVARFIRRVNTSLSASKDRLNVMRFSLTHLVEQFDSEAQWADLLQVQALAEKGQSLPRAICVLLQARMPALVEELNGNFREGVIESEIAPSEDQKEVNVHRFARSLQAKAWGVITQALEELNLAERLFSEEDQSLGRASDCLPEAAPLLPRSGGEKRLLVVCPRKTNRELACAGLSDCEAGRFTLVQAGESELAFCYEVQNLSLPAIAARLVADRPNCTLAAHRLHTRIDVSWTKPMRWD